MENYLHPLNFTLLIMTSELCILSQIKVYEKTCECCGAETVWGTVFNQLFSQKKRDCWASTFPAWKKSTKQETDAQLCLSFASLESMHNKCTMQSQWYKAWTTDTQWRHKSKKIWKFEPIWQPKYASVVFKNLGVGVDFRPCSAVKALSSPGVRSSWSYPYIT